MAATIQLIQKPTRARALDTSGNNNHGQIYSGRALEFDGVADKLTFNPTKELNNVTIACWVNSNLTGNWNTIFGHNSGFGSYIWFSINNNGGILAQLNKDDGSGSTLAHSSFTLANAVEEGTWYRAVLTYDSASKAIIYLNGVNVLEVATTGPLDDDAGNMQIGMNAGTGYPFDGMMSDFQYWGATWTADDVLFDYNNPEQLALNRGGTSLTNSNLKLWYPMNDGHRGQQSYILDASNTGLSDELLADTDVNDSSAWNGSGGSGSSEMTFSNGEAYTTGSNQWMTQPDVTTHNDGYMYKSVIRAKRATAGDAGVMQVYHGANSTTSYTLTDDYVDYTSYIANDAGSGSNHFYIYNASGNIKVTSVSFKKINAKNHATTVFYGDMSELLSSAQKTFFDDQLDDNDDLLDMGGTNGDGANTLLDSDGFVSDGSATATFGGDGAGEARLTNTASAKGLVTLAVTTVVGRTYRAGGNISTTGNSDIRFSVGTATTFNTDSQSGALTPNDDTSGESGDYVADDTTSFMQIQLESTTDTQYCEIDDFWIREVGTASGWTDADQQLDIPQTALQSYNQLAWFPGQEGSDATLDSQIATTTNNWSFSFWIFNFDDTTQLDFIIGSGSTRNLLIDNGSNRKLYYREVSTSTYYALSDAVIPEGKWVHAVVTATADTSMTAYINGEAQTTNSSMSDTELLVDRFMEGYSAGSHESPGSITEISYYNDVLTEAEVNDLYNDGKAKSALDASGSGGLVGYWRNNGLAEWEDLKGSNDANTNGVTETMLITAGADGSRDSQGFIMNRQRATNSLNFPDVGNNVSPDNSIYLNINNNPLVTSTISTNHNPFSISMWVKARRTYSAGIHNILWLADSDTSLFTVGIENGSSGFDLNISADMDNPTRPTYHNAVPTDDWVHIAVCCESGSHTGSNDQHGDTGEPMVDSAATWAVDELINAFIENNSDLSYGKITDNAATTIISKGFDPDDGTLETGTVGLSKSTGTDGEWDTSDNYNVIKVYIDGTATVPNAGDDTGTNSGTDNDNTYRLGSSGNDTSRQFIGEVDDVLIYDDKWLTQKEVTRIYNAGKRSHR